MKKIILMLMISIMSLTASAQKEYVTLYAFLYDTINQNIGHNMYLFGALPDGVKKVYQTTDKKTAVDILTILTENGYELESITSVGNSAAAYFLFSKTSSHDDGMSRLPVIQDDTEDVYEIARYNLQGIPVDKKYKGLQIIVYSNYTTKAFIQE